MAFHLSQDQTEAMTYFQWESLKDHENCYVSPDFAEINPAWTELMERGDLEFSLQVYNVVDVHPEV